MEYITTIPFFDASLLLSLPIFSRPERLCLLHGKASDGNKSPHEHPYCSQQRGRERGGETERQEASLYEGGSLTPYLPPEKKRRIRENNGRGRQRLQEMVIIKMIWHTISGCSIQSPFPCHLSPPKLHSRGSSCWEGEKKKKRKKEQEGERQRKEEQASNSA
jgi:hypothetical protein